MKNQTEVQMIDSKTLAVARARGASAERKKQEDRLTEIEDIIRQMAVTQQKLVAAVDDLRIAVTELAARLS